jgi:hypothetical protein
MTKAIWTTVQLLFAAWLLSMCLDWAGRQQP